MKGSSGRRKISMKNRAIVLAALVFIVIYNLLFFQTGFGIGTGLLFLTYNFYFFIIRNRQSPNLPFAKTSSVIAVLFAFLYAFRSNNIVQVIDFLAAVFFSLEAFTLYKHPVKISWKIPNFLSTPSGAAKILLVSIFQVFKKESWPQANSNSSTISSLLRGLAILAPVLAVLLIFLARADPIFGKLTQDFLSQAGERTVVSLALFIVLLGFGISKFTDKFEGTQEEAKVPEGKSYELAVISGGVLLLFAVFIGVQFRYLFSNAGEGDLAQLGINSLTYSEYVRKGFFELLIASVIACGVIIYSLRFLHRLEDSRKLLVQLFSGMLTIETGLLLFSAVKRLALYADVHGLTRARVFGFVFLVWLVLLLAVLLFRVFKQMTKEWFFGSVMAGTLIALLLINVLNVDDLIATRYVPTVNNEIDYYYLTSLSSDAYQSWKPALEDSIKMVTQLEKVQDLSTEDSRKIYWTRRALYQLFTNVGSVIDKYGTVPEILDWHKTDQAGWVEQQWVQQLREKGGSLENFPKQLIISRKWQSANAGEYAAYQNISRDMETFKQVPIFLYRIYELEKRVSSDVKRNTPLDRSTQPPLL